MDNLEDMKTMWIELNDRLSSLEEDNRKMARQIMSGKYKTAQERLISKYRLFIIIATIMIFYIIGFVGFNPLVDDKYRLVTVLYWIIFFLAEIGIDSYLLFKVKEIDIYHSSVTEIAAIAARNWKIHKIAIFCGLPVAIGAIVLFALALDADEYMIYGMLAGAVIGILIGLRQLMKFFSNYKILQSYPD